MQFSHSKRLMSLLAALCAIPLSTSDHAFAKGGTAKPPTVATTPLVTVLPPAGPALITPVSAANGFTITGFIQGVTVTGGCAGVANAGGTLTVNGIVITVPANTIVQFPANTLTWKEVVCPTATAQTYPIGLDGTGGGAPVVPNPLSSIEITVDGNIIGGSAAGGEHRAGLIYVSQQSLNSGSGYISFIDYTDGSIYVRTRTAAGANGELRLLINDPNGRFGRVQTNPDARFSVDDENPTIKSAETGYPMCVPRTNPATIDDALCPKRNRPAFGSCRSFTQAGINVAQLGAGGDLTPSNAGGFCSAFVMKAIRGMPGTLAPTFNAANAYDPALPANANEPDPRQQVPFVVGDFISWSGTLVRGGNAKAPVSTRATTTGAAGAGDVIWVHTINANVGVYTQPATLPAYIAIGEFGVGVDPSPTGAGATPGVEATARIFLEASVSDIASIVDVYLDDKGYTLPAGTPNGPLIPAAGREYFRWVTTEGMTGTLTDQASGKNPFITTAQPFGGGIQTQYVGPVPGRARIRANKVPAINPAIATCPSTGGSQGCAVTQSPSRNLRVVLRSLCAPAAGSAANTPAGNPGNLDGGAFFSINGARAPLPGAAAGDGTCLQSAQYANELFTGQYMAPVGEYIFPENTIPGAATTTYTFWKLDFLRRGEGGDMATGGLTPTPW